MDPQIFELLTYEIQTLNAQIGALDMKVDELVQFKYWFVGAAAGVSSLISAAFHWFFKS